MWIGLLLAGMFIAIFAVGMAVGLLEDRSLWKSGVVRIPIGPEKTLICHVTPGGDNQYEEACEIYRRYKESGKFDNEPGLYPHVYRE